MSQHDFHIANQKASNARADINDALQALASLSAGASAPATTYANMLWYDSNNNILKMRSEADDAWINIGYVDQSTNAFRILDDTQIVNTSGTQTGLLGDQATSAWETGSSTTESLVSPAKVKSAVESLVPEGLGDVVSAGNTRNYFDDTVYENETVFNANLIGSGSVRVSFEASRGGLTSQNTVEILLDGTSVYSNNFTDTGYSSATVDVTFTQYQKMEITTFGGNGFKNLELSTNTDKFIAIVLPGNGTWS